MVPFAPEPFTVAPPSVIAYADSKHATIIHIHKVMVFANNKMRLRSFVPNRLYIRLWRRSRRSPSLDRCTAKRHLNTKKRVTSDPWHRSWLEGVDRVNSEPPGNPEAGVNPRVNP